MRRLFLFVLLIGLVLLGVALLALGAFPPDARQTEIRKVLPNDRFGQQR